MHSRYNHLPKDVLFTRLLSLATESNDQIIADDRSQGTQFSYRHILHGTSTLLQKLQGLDDSVLKEPGKVYIAVLAPNGYEFIISVLAILAFGGVVVPMPESTKAKGALPGEAAYLLQQCNARYLLVSPKQADLGVQIQNIYSIATLIIDSQAPDQDLLPITSYTFQESMVVAEDCPSIVFFTSGTTGPPKGVLHARRTINKYALMAEVGPNDDICLIPSGAFWSVYFTKVFQMLLTGVRVEIHNFGRNYNLIWDKVREKNLTKIVLSPTFWYGMMHYFQEHLATLPTPEAEEYIRGIRHLRDACATGAMPFKKLKEFWKDLRGGRPLEVLYGSTETQEISICEGELDTTQDDLGIPVTGAKVKLDDTQGELLVKTPAMFLGYLNEPEATAERFDSEGYFKTGDLVTLHDGKLIFKARANMDLFKFYTYKVNRPQVEACLTALVYIVEGYILPVSDPHCDTRVAALVRVRDGVGKVHLERIRTDLSQDLPVYQLPTVLRNMEQHEEVPRTWSGKLAMRKAIQEFFPQDSNDRLYSDALEVMDISDFMWKKTTKLWDFSGMRQ